MVTVDSCRNIIAGLLVVDLIVGIISGYFNMEGETNSLLATLMVGIILMGITFYFVIKYGDLKYGRKVEKF